MRDCVMQQYGYGNLESTGNTDNSAFHQLAMSDGNLTSERENVSCINNEYQLLTCIVLLAVRMELSYCEKNGRILMTLSIVCHVLGYQK